MKLPTLYSKEDCQPCKAVKRWLQENNVPYNELGPEEAIKAGFRSVPVLVYRNETIFGFDTPKLQKVFPE